MDFSYINSYRGIAPGKVIARELGRRHIRQNAFAGMVGEHPQTLNAIISGRRGLPLELSLSIDRQLGFPEGFLQILQVFYDIDRLKTRSGHSSGAAPNVRRVLFWDTDFDNIDWQKHEVAAIERVMSKGNDKEKEEILRFYGRKD